MFHEIAIDFGSNEGEELELWSGVERERPGRRNSGQIISPGIFRNDWASWCSGMPCLRSRGGSLLRIACRCSQEKSAIERERRWRSVTNRAVKGKAEGEIQVARVCERARGKAYRGSKKREGVSVRKCWIKRDERDGLRPLVRRNRVIANATRLLLLNLTTVDFLQKRSLKTLHTNITTTMLTKMNKSLEKRI